ncbi:carboxypeptidase regulatory-like domain-containing protein [Geomonas paludis]|uniref:Carboxypeptidase regulatory-like domain-containing protein n=2 Tax=Geomonas paludis TaxID=2740185 RepID=A0ABY4LKA9_9BACT|nr:carboxypeptidase regulatory-like domain-containing protein [Geomonas paludis]UPU38279.1 carboxypeptidase regulatory-like domain-containing protein [Geomonas paludis]
MEQFLNSTSYSLDENNGSVYQYFMEVSNSRLSYTNVVTPYVRMSKPKSYYNDVTYDCGSRGRLLITDALAILKARSDYATTILPTLNTLTTDSSGYVRGFNVFFAGYNSGVWAYGLWPHSWALSSPVSLGNGKYVYHYQITDIGSAPTLGTFCHENGHMICGFPDIYDYDYDSSGGAGYFSLMGYGSLFSKNPSQVDAYLKTAAGWASVTDLDSSTSLAGTLVAAPGSGYNTFYRYRNPVIPTEYYLLENRQRVQRDSLLPGSGIAVWHVDELGNRDNQSTVPNSTHQNYELSLVQADNQYHLQNDVNAGDFLDLFFLGNTAAGYANRLDDTTAPAARWWDGTPSMLKVSSFGASGMSMALDFESAVAYTVCGTVRAGSATGPVIAGASVSIGEKMATTNSTGNFCISGLAAGVYTLTVAKAGYVTHTDMGYIVDRDANQTFFLMPEPLYYLSGTVHSGSSTGPLLPGATVSVAGKSATTDSYGAFTVTGIPQGTYTITVSKSGYNTLTVPYYTVRGDRSGVVYYLTAAPTYYLSGTVRSGSSTGPVLPGATVSIAGKTTTTSSTGTFTITGISAGTYTVTVSKSGYNTLTIPNYTVSGNRSGVLYYLTAASTYYLSGTVRSGSSTGPVLPGATVSIAGKSTTTSSTGTFTITGIPAGTYTLTISKTGYYTKTVTGYTMTSNRSGTSFYLSQLPTYYLSGTVRSGSSTGPVLSGATVSIAGKTTTTSSTGTFTITGIPSGTYTLTISKTGYYTKTVTGYTMTSNRSGTSFYLSQMPTYYLSGTVRSGSSTGPVLSGATVSIAGKTTTTSSTGTFTITGILAGTYTVSVYKSGYNKLTVPNYTVSGNRSGAVFYLTPVPTYYVSGTVRSGSSTGPVVSGATVSIAGKTATTSSTGSFTISGIPAGTYTVTIYKAGYTTRTVTGFSVTGNRSGVVFYLSPSASASGREIRETISSTGIANLGCWAVPLRTSHQGGLPSQGA